MASGLAVVMANSRRPESLAEVIGALGPMASAGTVADVAEAGDVVVLSIPLIAVRDLPRGVLDDKVVIDTSNYNPSRDGRIEDLDSEAMTTSELVTKWFGNARLVKAFNNIMARHIGELSRPDGADDRSALPVSSDDAAARAWVQALIEEWGFDTVDAGPLAGSWTFEPETEAYVRLYLADPGVRAECLMSAPSGSTGSSRLSAALARSSRVRVAARAY